MLRIQMFVDKCAKGLAAFVGGTILFFPFAFLLEGITGFRTPGTILSSIVLNDYGKCGFLTCLTYGLWIALVTDAVFGFTLVCVGYTIFHRVQKLRPKNSNEMTTLNLSSRQRGS